MLGLKLIHVNKMALVWYICCLRYPTNWTITTKEKYLTLIDPIQFTAISSILKEAEWYILKASMNQYIKSGICKESHENNKQ